MATLAEIERKTLDEIASKEAELAAIQKAISDQKAALVVRITQKTADEMARMWEIDRGDLDGSVSISISSWCGNQDLENENITLCHFSSCINIPEHCEITVRFCRAEFVNGNLIVVISERDDLLDVRECSGYQKSFDDALVASGREWRAIKEREEREAEESRRYDEREAEESRRYDERQIKRDTELADILRFISSDEVSLRMCQAFVAIQRDRKIMEDKLESAAGAMDDIEACYERRLEEANKRAHNSQRDAEYSARQAQAARDDADLAERKLKQSERGW